MTSSGKNKSFQSSALFALCLQTYSKGTIALETRFIASQPRRTPQWTGQMYSDECFSGEQKQTKKPQLYN